jgi:hypothetical protein
MQDVEAGFVGKSSGGIRHGASDLLPITGYIRRV